MNALWLVRVLTQDVTIQEETLERITITVAVDGKEYAPHVLSLTNYDGLPRYVLSARLEDAVPGVGTESAPALREGPRQTNPPTP